MNKLEFPLYLIVFMLFLLFLQGMGDQYPLERIANNLFDISLKLNHLKYIK